MWELSVRARMCGRPSPHKHGMSRNNATRHALRNIPINTGVPCLEKRGGADTFATQTIIMCNVLYEGAGWGRAGEGGGCLTLGDTETAGGLMRPAASLTSLCANPLQAKPNPSEKLHFKPGSCYDVVALRWRYSRLKQSRTVES
jgi:hypothetical protein